MEIKKTNLDMAELKVEEMLDTMDVIQEEIDKIIKVIEQMGED